MTLDCSMVASRLRVIRRAQELGSVTAACREAGFTRTAFYRWRQRFERFCVEGLHPRWRLARAGRPSQVLSRVERLIVGWALAWPTWGCGRVVDHLDHHGLARLSPSTMRRAGLLTRPERLGVLEIHGPAPRRSSPPPG
jgi:hypothetical protein